MALSIFLAKWFGLYMLIIAAIAGICRTEFERSIREFLSSRVFITFAGILNLLLGLAIAIAHPVWTLDWKGLITLLGYLSIIKGIIRLGFPSLDQTWALKTLQYYWAFFAFLTVMGLYLAYSGFTA